MDRRNFIVGAGSLVGAITVFGLPAVSAEPIVISPISPSIMDQINTRRLIIMIQGHMREAIQDCMFEFNDDILRKHFRDWMTYVLDNYQAQRLLEDYRIVCDESNNTPELIDRNEFTADLYIKPTKALNFIKLTALVGRTSIPFEEVI